MYLFKLDLTVDVINRMAAIEPKRTIKTLKNYSRRDAENAEKSKRNAVILSEVEGSYTT